MGMNINFIRQLGFCLKIGIVFNNKFLKRKLKPSLWNLKQDVKVEESSWFEVRMVFEKQIDMLFSDTSTSLCWLMIWNLIWEFTFLCMEFVLWELLSMKRDLLDSQQFPINLLCRVTWRIFTCISQTMQSTRTQMSMKAEVRKMLDINGIFITSLTTSRTSMERVIIVGKESKISSARLWSLFNLH